MKKYQFKTQQRFATTGSGHSYENRTKTKRKKKTRRGTCSTTFGCMLQVYAKRNGWSGEPEALYCQIRLQSVNVKKTPHAKKM